LLVLVNGLVNSQTSALDRGLLYGQSVFETIAVSDNKLCLIELHLARLSLGCERLGIPFHSDQIHSDLERALQWISTNSAVNTKAVIRITLSMGEGGRGYLNPETSMGNRVVSVHPYPEHPSSHWLNGVTIGVADIRLAHQPALAGLKHGNRLEQVIARSQWQADWHEALLLDLDNKVIEATQSNVFMVKGTIYRIKRT